MKNIITFLIFVISSVLSYGQVTEIKYQLNYDHVEKKYDVYVHIIKGKATKTGDKTLFNTQISLVANHGIGLVLEANHRPIRPSTNQPMEWFITCVLRSPSITPHHDYYSITPSLSPIGVFDSLQEGDAIKLFSVKVVNGDAGCGQNVRLFENKSDPQSNSDGMAGGDFRNGFTLGGPKQRYIGNLPTEVSIFASRPFAFCGTDINIFSNLSQNDNDKISYSWNGPFGYASTEKDVNIIAPTQDNHGIYTLIAENNEGCRDTFHISSEGKLDINPMLEIVNQDLVATTGASTYTWYDCITNKLLMSGMSSIFTPQYEGSYYVEVEKNGCTTNSDCILFSPTSTVESKIETKLTPNPVTNILTIHSTEEILNLKILNNNNALCLETNNSSQIDVSTLPSGVYIVKIKHSDLRITIKRFIKI